MNSRNYSQRSNYMCGTSSLDLLPFYVQTINIPGLSFSLPETGGRSGARLKLNSDTVTFGSLSLELIMDENYRIYKEITDIVFEHINVESGSYAAFDFDFWVEVTDDMGKPIMKVEFSGCKFESLGDLSFDSMDDSTEHTFPIELSYDYYNILWPGAGLPTLRR